MEMAIGLVLATTVAWFVRKDAIALDHAGRRVGPFSPDAWFAGVFLFLILFLPWYLIRRRAVLFSGSLPPRGWIPDPEDPTQYRWWDGTKWTDDRAPIEPTEDHYPPT